MESNRAIGVVFATILFAFGQADTANAQAQDMKDQVQNALHTVLPRDLAGSPIGQSDQALAYGAAVVGFILVFGLTLGLVRLIAYLIQFACFAGGLGLLCWLVHENLLTTWPMLMWTTVSVASYLAVTFAMARLFTLSKPPSRKEQDKLILESMKTQAETIGKLMNELAELKEKIP
jgi:hypothetical protein